MTQVRNQLWLLGMAETVGDRVKAGWHDEDRDEYLVETVCGHWVTLLPTGRLFEFIVKEAATV